MIVLYIILALVFLIAFILFLNISLVFLYKDDFDFKIKFLCFSFDADKIIELAESSDKNKNEQKELAEKKKTLKKKDKTPFDIIDTVDYIVSIIGAVLGEFVRYAKIKFTRIKIGIGTENSAETALLYGIVSSALYSLLEFFDSFLTVKKNYKDIGVFPDFASEKCRIDLKIVLKIKIIHLLFAFIHISPAIAAKKGK